MNDLWVGWSFFVGSWGLVGLLVLLVGLFCQIAEFLEDCVLNFFLDVGLLVFDLGELVGVSEEVVDLTMAGFIGSYS